MTNKTLRVSIQRLDFTTPLIPLPTYATPGSAGMDLRAAVLEPVIIRVGETVLVPTGIKIELPEGHEAQVRPRSGLAINHGLGILNSPGTIDSDYRGEIKVILTNFGKHDFTITRGERIAQLVVAPYVRVEWEETESLARSDRGDGGFGHSGR